MIVHVREGDGLARRPFPPGSQKSTRQFSVFLFPFLVIKARHHIICSGQPYHLEWQQKKRRHQQSFRMQVVHSTAPSPIIDGRVCQNYSEPREGACSLQQLAAEQVPRERQGGQGIKVRLGCTQPARCGRATAF